MQKWTEEEIADLREMYPDHGTEDVANGSKGKTRFLLTDGEG